MIRTNSEDPSVEFIAFVRLWFDLLASNHFSEACAALDEANTYGIRWSPHMIIERLNEEFGPGTVFGEEHPEGVSVSLISETEGNAYVDVIEFSDGSGYSLYHDVPLNGIWSDLTAQFEFKRSRSGYAVVLHDLHVM